jgi:glyceraldehyde 3-phosphate dehydrogenase
MVTVAINGFGRIGRSFLRTFLCDHQAQKKLNIVAINIGQAALEETALLFKYDTIMGTYPASVSFENNELIIDTKRIRIVAQKDPQRLPWKELAVDWVVDASGHFTHRKDALLHIQAGARNVLITAPAKDEDVTIIPGVNDAAFNPILHHIVSLGSCTTNAVIPTLKVIDDAFGIQYGCMTTVHAYTNSQVLLDREGEDIRRSRAAALNIIPTSTGAMNMITKIIPHLSNRIQTTALRVPVAIVSLIDLTFIAQKPVTCATINQAFSDAQKNMPGIVAVSKEPLVSSDFKGNEHSVIIDSQLTAVSGTSMGKVFGWYDNEWGYSTRLKDFLTTIA